MLNMHRGSNVMRIEIENRDLASILACLVLGLLESMRAGVIPAEAGIGTTSIWTLVEDDSNVPQELITIWKALDELWAIQDYLPPQYDHTLIDLIERTRGILTQVGAPRWAVHFVEDQQEPYMPLE
jgi:hypothetical protein